MYIKFKPGSEAEKVALTMIQKKDEQLEKAVQIIEEITGRKVQSDSQISYVFFLSENYSWSPNAIYFEGNDTVPGYNQDETCKEGFRFVANKKSKVWKDINKRFNDERFSISSEPLNDFGIYTVGKGLRPNSHDDDLHYYGWKLFKHDGSVRMPIAAPCADMIDWTKSNDQFTVEFK